MEMQAASVSSWATRNGFVAQGCKENVAKVLSPRDAKRMLRKLYFFIKMAKKHAVEVNHVNLNLKLFPGTLQTDLIS